MDKVDEKEVALKQLTAMNQQLIARVQKLKAMNQQLVANEKILIENEARFRGIFENSPVGKSITGLDGSLHINNSFCEMLGYTKDELENINWDTITHPDDIEESAAIVKALLDGKETKARFEKRYIHKDGHIVLTDVRTTLFKNKDGEPLYFITMVTDITQQKESEEKILKQVELTDSIIDSLPGIFYHIDTQGKYKRWNRRFLEVTGFNDEEMEKINAVEFFRGDDVENVAAAMKTVFTEGETKVEANLYLKSGESIPYLFTGIKFDIEGKPFILGMGLDISEMRATQTKLKKTVHELEAFNKMAVGREKRMIDLKARINKLSKELGRNEPYNLSFAEREN